MGILPLLCSVYRDNIHIPLALNPVEPEHVYIRSNTKTPVRDVTGVYMRQQQMISTCSTFILDNGSDVFPRIKKLSTDVQVQGGCGRSKTVLLH